MNHLCSGLVGLLLLGFLPLGCGRESGVIELQLGPGGSGGSVGGTGADAGLGGEPSGGSGGAADQCPVSCADDVPYCASGTCVECLVPEHCEDEDKPLCSVTGRCVACTTSADCAAEENPVCDVQAGECVECQSPDDCASGFCDLVERECR